jgi:hypothetical protein
MKKTVINHHRKVGTACITDISHHRKAGTACFLEEAIAEDGRKEAARVSGSAGETQRSI